MIRDRKPTKQPNKQNPKDMLKNKVGKRRGRNRRRNDDGCCEELDHFFVCCIKLFSFIEVILDDTSLNNGLSLLEFVKYSKLFSN